MKSFFILIFCKSYEFAIWVEEDSGISPAFSGVYALGLSLSMNILTIYLMIRKLLGFAYEIHGLPLYLFFTFCILLIWIIFNFFVKANKYKVFYYEFKKQSQYAGRKGAVITWIYIIFSILAPIFFALVFNFFFNAE
jgi:hypothetical protein